VSPASRREALVAHSVLRLNHDLLTLASGVWMERRADHRSLGAPGDSRRCGPGTTYPNDVNCQLE